MIRFLVRDVLPLAAAALTIIVLAFTLPSHAHEWYGKRRDPIYSTTTCCGGSDCAPLPAHSIKASPDGSIRVSLTLDEVRKINPRRDEPFDEIIPFERVQTVPPEGTAGPHICLMNRNRADEGDMRQGFYCIFLPPNG